MVKISKAVGRVIQLYTLFLINGSLYFELYVRGMQAIYDMLEELGEYENQFNYITGWPCYFFVSVYYYTACAQSSGRPVKGWNYANPMEGRECGACGCAKPERCFHCSRCGTCVTKRDHHCDFTNQCVGAGNYKAFFWFTLTALIAAMHPGLRLAQWCYHYYLQDLESVNSCSEGQAVTHFVVMSMYFSMILFTIMLTKMNFQNSFTNCTRLDVMGEMDHPPICGGQPTDPMNEYDLGMCRNWICDFGWNPLLWLWPSAAEDSYETYPAHRFPMWQILSVMERAELKHTKLEKIQLATTKQRKLVVAREGNLKARIGWRSAPRQ